MFSPRTGAAIARGPAFTLMEMLVVISIITLLISMLAPSLRRARDAAWDSKCAGKLRQVMVALDSYLVDGDDTIFWRGNQTWQNDPIAAGMDWYVYAGRETGNTYSGGQGNFFEALQPRPLNPYLNHNHRAVLCPYDNKAWKWAAGNIHWEWVGNSYIFNTFGSPELGPSLSVGLAGQRSSQASQPSLTVAFLDCTLVRAPLAWHRDGLGNIAFLDTHVELLGLPRIGNDRGIRWDP